MSTPRHAARQDQFLEVIDRDTAWQRFAGQLDLRPLGSEHLALDDALGRVLSQDITAQIDVPGFDRANVDGFALRAAETFGATEDAPRYVRLNRAVLSPGVVPAEDVPPGTATTIATGGMLPRGADAVLMVEYSDIDEPATGERADELSLRITRAVAPGEHISHAGTDIARGETVLRTGQVLTSREIGVIAALGLAEVDVYRQPRVAILSTGDEILPPGQPAKPASVYDSNAAILAAAVRELGGEPIPLGIVADDEQLLAERVQHGLQYDVLLLSGGTSKGAGDLSYRVVSQLGEPGIVAHGVALKPGKPICLAVTQGKPVVILPGFPTSAIFTFHEFVAPVIRSLAGRPTPRTEQVTATLPVRVNSERGRTEFLLVGLVRTDTGLAAYPMGKGSGSVTTFSLADGFITIDQHTEQLEAGTPVAVQLLGQQLAAADLVAMGSHCVGLDYLLGLLQREGLSVKTMHIGSTGGLAAVKRGQCDLAGIHLLDPATNSYNQPYISEDLVLIPGYRRRQGVVYRPGDPRFEHRTLDDAITHALADPACTLINRNPGSGTRILLDPLLTRILHELRSGARNTTPLVDPQRLPPDITHIPGYAVQTKSHNAVAAAIAQGRADWGLAIDTVAHQYGLAFLPYRDEHYDFAVPRSRLTRPALQRFQQLLRDPQVQQHLQELGFQVETE